MDSPEDIESWRRAADKLGALEAAGVDNWEGYSHAMSMSGVTTTDPGHA